MGESKKPVTGSGEFQRIRRYLNLIYLYGFSSRKDFADANKGSAKNYDAVLGILRQLLDAPEDGKSKRSTHFFRRDYHRSGESPMSNAYLFHTMNYDREMVEYLAILSRLGQGTARSKDLETAVELTGSGGEKILDPKTSTKRRNTLYSYGVIQNEGRLWRMERDAADGLTDGQLLQLREYARFSAAVTFPRVAGSFLERTLNRKLYARGLEEAGEAPFLLRHNSYHNCLDEELVYQLLPLMEERRYVLFDDRRRLPLKIRVDTRLGRWYVLCKDQEGNACIEKITLTKELTGREAIPADEWQKHLEEVEGAYEHSLCSHKLADPVTVRAELEFPADSGIRRQFLREMPMGNVEGECFAARMTDPVELKPFLRAYGPWLRLLPGEDGLREMLGEDYRQMIRNLELDAGEEQTLEMAGEDLPLGDPGTVSRGTNLVLFHALQNRAFGFSLALMAKTEGKTVLSRQETEALARRFLMDQDYLEAVLESLERAGFLCLHREGKTWVGCSHNPEAHAPRRPVMPMSGIESEYLQYILRLPEAELFLDDQTRAALLGRPPRYLDGIHRLRPPGDPSRNPEPEVFRAVLKAIRDNRWITYRFKTRNTDTYTETCCIPWKLEYSNYDHRWWVILYDPAAHRTVKAVLANLKDVKPGDCHGVSQGQILEAIGALKEPEPVVLRVNNARRSLERCFLQFETQEILYSKNLGNGVFELCFTYYKFDRVEILRKLMQLGPAVTLMSPQPLREELGVLLRQALEKTREEERNEGLICGSDGIDR